MKLKYSFEFMSELHDYYGLLPTWWDDDNDEFASIVFYESGSTLVCEFRCKFIITP